MSQEKQELTDIGILVGRFQVPELHQAHKELVEKIAAGTRSS